MKVSNGLCTGSFEITIHDVRIVLGAKLMKIVLDLAPRMLLATLVSDQTYLP